MKLQELYDYDGKSASKINQRSLFAQNMMKVKTLLLVAGFLLISIGFYVERKRVDHKMIKLENQFNAMDNLLSDAKINSHVSKREVEGKSHVNKRNAVDGEEEFEDLTPSSRGGATYIRWGSRNCEGPEHTKLVYEGVAAGSKYNKHGGGSNVICIDLNVSYTPGKYQDGNQGGSYFYGMEYHGHLSLFDLSRTEGNSVYNFNAPCAACMAKGTVNQLMIPGRETCPPYWKKEYTGYIMATQGPHKHSIPYLCVDDTPQVVPGSDAGLVHGVLFTVETQCPSLQCEPFVHGRELRCAVCTI